MSLVKAQNLNKGTYEISSHVMHENELISYEPDQEITNAIVRTGMLISNCKKTKKDPMIINMYFPGDVISYDAMKVNDCDQMEYKSIETSSLCFLDSAALQYHHSLQVDSLQKQLYFSNEGLMFKQMLLNQRNPMKRVAFFIINIINKKQLEEFDNIQLKINLSRKQIGMYLGLVEESIVRALRKLYQMDLLMVNTRNYLIPSYKKLLEFYKNPDN